MLILDHINYRHEESLALHEFAHLPTQRNTKSNLTDRFEAETVTSGRVTVLVDSRASIKQIGQEKVHEAPCPQQRLIDRANEPHS